MRQIQILAFSISYNEPGRMPIQQETSRLATYFASLERALRTDRRAAETAVDEYLDSVHATLLNSAAARRQREESRAPDFAVLPYISPDENRLSEILSDLLDPQGDHGQRDAFLQCFLKRIHCVQNVPRDVKVTCEDPAAYCPDFGSRIDITIDFGGFGIGIENKPWAPEGKEQLQRYAEHLQKKYRGKYWLVFITRDGRPPRSLRSAELKAMRARRRFRQLSYNWDLPQWLEECRSCCKANYVRGFLRDLQGYLKQEFGGGNGAPQGAKHGTSHRD